jgi:hypothetical protein
VPFVVITSGVLDALAGVSFGFTISVVDEVLISVVVALLVTSEVVALVLVLLGRLIVCNPVLLDCEEDCPDTGCNMLSS